MEIPTLKLYAEEYEKIRVVLGSLLDRSSATSASLISRTGQELAFRGDREALDRDSISSLAAGSMAATLGLAHFLGEEEFERIYHLGKKNSVVMSPVGKLALLLVVMPNGQPTKPLVENLGRTVLLLRDLLDRENVRFVQDEGEAAALNSLGL